jgi:hypothetical protein
MTTPQDNMHAACVPPKTGRTWLPILLGVICGVVAFSSLAEYEPSAFWQLTAWMFNEEPPAKVSKPETTESSGVGHSVSIGAGRGGFKQGQARGMMEGDGGDE